MARSLVLPPSRTGVQGPVADLFAQWSSILNGKALARLEGVVSVVEKGAVGGGVDDTAAYLRAIDAAEAQGGGRVITNLSSKISQTLEVPANVELFLGSQAVLTAGANEHVVRLRRNARITGTGAIDVSDFSGFDKAGIYIRGETDGWPSDENNTVIGTVRILGANGDETGLWLDCPGSNEAMVFVRTEGGGPFMRRLGYGVRLSASGTDAYCNGNVIQFVANAVEYGVHISGESGGNMLYGQIQVGATTQRAIYCEGDQNTIEAFVWDWRDTRPGWPTAIELTAASRGNRIIVPSLQGFTISDLGLNNRVDNIADQPYGISIPLLPVGRSEPMLGRFDARSDVCQQATERHTVTGSFTPVSGSSLANAFDGDPNTYVRCDTSGEQTLEVELASNLTLPYLVGVQFGSDLYATDVAVEIYDADEADWVTLAEKTDNDANELVGYAGGRGVTNVSKVRARFDGFRSGFTESRITRLYAYFSDAKPGEYRDLVAKGGYRQQLNGWQQTTTVAASQTNVVLTDNVTPNGRPMAGNGSLLAVMANTSSAVTAGTLTVSIQKSTDGGTTWSATGLSIASVAMTSGQLGTTTQAKDVLRFNLGDMFRARVTTTSDFAPTANNLYVSLLVEIDTP